MRSPTAAASRLLCLVGALAACLACMGALATPSPADPRRCTDRITDASESRLLCPKDDGQGGGTPSAKPAKPRIVVPPDQQKEPDAPLFEDSPMCDSVETANCSRSGSLARPYPLTHYGLDNWVEVGLGNVDGLIPSAVQTMTVLAWSALLQGLSGVLLLLEWAFHLSLTEDAMPDVHRVLLDLHNNVLGKPWMLLAISVAGLWGIYNGLLRRRTMETIGALLATLLLMAAGLWVIQRPDDTVGTFSRLSSDSALSVLGLGTQGTARNGERSFASMDENVFTMLVLNPWCALMFNGDKVSGVDFCRRTNQNANKDKAGHVPEVKDEFLQYPAWSTQRKDLYEAYAESPYKANVSLLGKDGAFARIGLFAVILVGLVGALLLFFYLAIKLVFASVATLFLTLVAPVMMLAPAFGEAGRNAFFAWVKRLAGYVFAKLRYALALAIVAFLANMISGLDGLDWGARWLILLCLFWGAFLKRHELDNFGTDQRGAGSGSGLGLAKLAGMTYLGVQFGRMMRASAPYRAATYAPRKAWEGAKGGTRAGIERVPGLRRLDPRWRHDQAQARDQVARDSIKEELRTDAGRRADKERAKAVDTLKRDEQWREYNSKQGRKRGPKPAGKQPPDPAEVQEARGVVSRYGADRNKKIAITDADVERYARTSNNPRDVARYESTREPGLKESEVGRARRRTPRFDEKVTAERKRHRRKEKEERRRKRVYRS